MGEAVLEDRLHGKLQEFLLEPGDGFRFKARQKRILIGEMHNAGYWLPSDFSLTSFMKTAVSERHHPRLGAIFKSEPQIFTGIGDKYGVAAFRVFCLDIFGFMHV